MKSLRYICAKDLLYELKYDESLHDTGRKLASFDAKAPQSNTLKWLRKVVYLLLNFILLTSISALLLWWIVLRPDIDPTVMLIVLPALIAAWLLVYYRFGGHEPHALLANDRLGFMHDLRLDAKIAIFDGSNIYHLGHVHGFDARPLGEIVNQLRDQGYRIVCFFDANIFYTLSEHGAFPSHQAHSVTLLEDIFGLRQDEIYVVPSGVQADKYVLESLKHLPISFAISNDQYRDYSKEYSSVMKDSHWRKGVVIRKIRSSC
ncbi:hypothetical protein [Thioclava sp.]|uniref:hypothetical protein n=1 Tax=Thioclava sp. TaxID=1933450 RepID=UPI003AA7BD5E